MTEFTSSDEHIPTWLDEYEIDDPQFEILQRGLADLSELPKNTCGVCGMEVTQKEISANNGHCPGCDTNLDDIPF